MLVDGVLSLLLCCLADAVLSLLLCCLADAVLTLLHGRRDLPLEHGRSDAPGVLAVLQHIGYDGPVVCEPFNRRFEKMPMIEAVTTVRDVADCNAFVSLHTQQTLLILTGQGKIGRVLSQGSSIRAL